jgi:hypothetical protein
MCHFTIYFVCSFYPFFLKRFVEWPHHASTVTIIVARRLLNGAVHSRLATRNTCSQQQRDKKRIWLVLCCGYYRVGKACYVGTRASIHQFVRIILNSDS